MENKICSFFGHRNVECKEEVFYRVLNLVKKLIKDNYSIFLFGGFGEFDDICYAVVTQLKKEYPYLRRVYCYSDEKQFLREKRRGLILDTDYEKFEFLSLDYDYWYTRIYFRNCKMVDLSDIIVFYAEEKESSGAFKTLKYAVKTKKEIYNVYKE